MTVEQFAAIQDEQIRRMSRPASEFAAALARNTRGWPTLQQSVEQFARATSRTSKL